jgi:integrase
VTATWADPDWGTLVWLAMTIGARRGELCALRWQHVDLGAGVLTLRRSAYLDEEGNLQEKDTKTHQQRRVALDSETLEILREHHADGWRGCEPSALRCLPMPMCSRRPQMAVKACVQTL